MGLMDRLYRGIRPEIYLPPVDEELAVTAVAAARLVSAQSRRTMEGAKRLQHMTDLLTKAMENQTRE